MERCVAAAPTYLSSDHDPLYRFHQWQANVRILNIRETKTVPYVPRSHPVVKRLIGTVRRECLDRMLFWTAVSSESSSSSSDTTTSIARMRGRQGARRRRPPTRPALGQVSGRIGGRRTVVGFITRRGRHDAVDPQRVYAS